jgi:uncharacterized membrane protein
MGLANRDPITVYIYPTWRLRLTLGPVAATATLFVTLTALGLLLVHDWRISIGLLAAQYVGVFALVALQWPITMAVVKLITGWIAGTVLSMAVLSTPEVRDDVNAGPANRSPRFEPDKYLPSSRIFYLLASVLVCLAIITQVLRMQPNLPDLPTEQAWGSLILIGLGLLKLGFSSKPLPTILGLLTVFAGLEILYANLDSAPLTAGLLAGVNLALALGGAYLLLAPHMEESE